MLTLTLCLRTREPQGLVCDRRNNVVYNWGGSAAGYNADGSNGIQSITRMNFVGNYYRTGPDSRANLIFAESAPSSQTIATAGILVEKIKDTPP